MEDGYVIRQFAIPKEERFTITIPDHSEILGVGPGQANNEKPCLFMAIPTNETTQKDYHFVILQPGYTIKATIFTFVGIINYSWEKVPYFVFNVLAKEVHIGHRGVGG